MVKLGATEKLILSLLSKKGWMSTKQIVELLNKINKSESAVRATLFRLREKKLLKNSHSGRESFFSLEDAGRDLIVRYKGRITRAEKKWEGKWLLFSFNIPEKKRSLRNILRDELLDLGFGRLHANLWILPFDIREECCSLIEKLKVKEYTAMFLTDYIGDDPKNLAYRVWNLRKFSKTYSSLSEEYKKQFEHFKKADQSDTNQLAMEALVRLLKFKEELVNLSSIYPHLPAELLPDNWIGFELKKVVLEYLQFLYQRCSHLVDFTFMNNENKK